MLTQGRLKYFFSYDEKTGRFTRVRATGSTKVGFSPEKPNTLGYIVIRIDGALYLAHRLAFLYMQGSFPKFDVDHVNGIRSDNSFVNLRPATRGENNQNRRKYLGRSKVPGAYWHKRVKKWAAQIRVDGVNTHLGYFETVDEAGAAYMRAKRKDHPFGEIAKPR